MQPSMQKIGFPDISSGVHVTFYVFTRFCLEALTLSLK